MAMRYILEEEGTLIESPYCVWIERLGFKQERGFLG